MKCPVCGSTHQKLIVARKSFPVLQNAIFNTPEDAKAVPRGEIEFYRCTDCDFLFNAKYRQVDYGSNYENFQGNSILFDEYVGGNAERIVNHISKITEPVTIIEIGCGQGDFLKRIMNQIPLDANVKAVGFDPAYTGEVDADERYKIFPEYFSDKAECLRGRGRYVIIARHVIEHIQNPHEMLKVFDNLSGQIDLFFETPDYKWILKNAAFEDIVYEHCSFFSPQSIQKLLLMHGFATTYFKNTFNNQYMWIEARRIADGGKNYSAREKELISTWRKILAESDCKIYVWGAGAKGVAFLNLLDAEKIFVDKVIDINPKKQRHFLSGTGHEIVAPEYLQTVRDKILIVVMNENYLDEIKFKVEQIKIPAPKFMTLDEILR